MDLELSIRVTCPAEDVQIGVYDGNTLLKSQKFRKVHPAQMIKLKLPGSQTKGINSLRVEVI